MAPVTNLLIRIGDKNEDSRGRGFKVSREKIKGKNPLAISGQRLAISCQQQENKKGRRQGFKVSRVNEKTDSGTELNFLMKKAGLRMTRLFGVMECWKFYTPF